MSLFDYFWIDRYLEVFAFIILAFVAFQKKRPIFLIVILLLNSLPDLWLIPSSERVHWLTPPESTAYSSPHWLEEIQSHPPQSLLTTIFHPVLQALQSTKSLTPSTAAVDSFNPIAFYIRLFTLILMLLLFLIDHVHGVAGLGAFLFPIFYFLQRLFQGVDFILPFQFLRQLALLRKNPLEYINSLNSNPSGMWMFVLGLSIISFGLLILFYFTRRQSRTYNIHIPNPENYQVLLEGKRYDYLSTRAGVFIANIEFPLAQAMSNQSTRMELHFISGTVLHFVKREE